MNERPRPVLGLLVAPDPPSGVAPFLQALARWSEPRVVEPTEPEPAAWFASSPAALVLRAQSRARHGLPRAERVPVAVWAASGADVEAAVSAGAAVVVTDDADVASAGDGRCVIVGGGLDASAYVPLTPFVRARWRARYGLPRDLVVVIDGNNAEGFSDELVPTALAVAAAAAVRGRRLLEALAWATPCATDAASASAVGATDGVEVVVGEPASLPDLARQLAQDQPRAATVARAGRRLVERHHDGAGAAAAVAERLGLVGSDTSPLARAERALAELRTPADARIRERVELAVLS